MYCKLILILMLSIIGILLYLKIKNVSKSVNESFVINDNNYNNNMEDEEGGYKTKSSGLIGDKGILQLLPHCYDITDPAKKKFPNCCDEVSFKDNKCNRLFPKFVYYRKENNTWKQTKENKSGYTYNPLFPYSRKKQGSVEYDKIFKGLDFLGLPPCDDNSDGNPQLCSHIEDIPRLQSATIDGDTILSNNAGIIINYMKNLTMGKNKSKDKQCSFSNPDNCVPIGVNRWEKIGKCPNDPQKDLYTYIDVQTKYSDLNNYLPDSVENGLLEGVIKDLYSLNPIDVALNLGKVVGNRNICMNTIDRTDKEVDGKHRNYIDYIGDKFK